MSEIENSVVTKKYLDVIETYRPMDDVFMRNIFRESPELVEMVLRIIIDKPDLQVIRSETQADLIRITGSRGLCLDVYATDDAGKKYDVEVQKESSDMKPERARYHASAMDVENSWHGMTGLKDSSLQPSDISTLPVMIQREFFTVLKKILQIFFL